MYKISVFNNISPAGLAQFNADRYQVVGETKAPDAILVRSHNLHTTHLADSVQVVGRAGVGVNNIPVSQLTARGIPVLNTPGANANAVKELVISGMLLASRNIYQAWDYVRQIEGDDTTLQQTVEQSKKRFAGFELPGKTLGVIGLGKVGVQVANVATHLGMTVIGYDPAITVRNAWELSAAVTQAESLNDVLSRVDFITLHVPLNDHTHHLIDTQQLKLMHPGAVLLNFARAEIVNITALAHALETKQIRNYVCDFPCHRFKNNPAVISFPHLGASTREAEENCASMIVEQVKDYLENGTIRNSINFPSIKLPRRTAYRIAVANLNVPNMVAQISTILSSAGINIIDMINKSRAGIAYTLLDVNAAINPDVLTQIRTIDGVVRARQLPSHAPDADCAH